MDKEQAVKLYNFWDSHLKEFVEDFFGKDLFAKIPKFHEEIYSLLQNTPRLVLAAPRGFAKSKIVSKFYPLHSALFQNKQDICIISASEGLATEWLRQIRRELESNRLIIQLFGNLKSSKWTENHIILNNKAKTNIRARGAGGQIRGFRPDLVILDDIETDESVLSEEQRSKMRDWVFKACLNTLLPHGQFIWIGTIIHPLALIQEMLDSDNGWIKRKYQAYIENVQEPGHELWPDLWPHEKLQERKKEIGTWAFASEYLNDPVLNESAPIQPDQIRYWTELPEQYSVVISVDPAYSDDEKADFKVASVVGIDEKGNRYLISYVRTHEPIGEFQNAVINLYLQHKGVCTGVGIPSGGVEKGFLDSFLKRCDERKIYPPIQELKNTYTNAQTQVSKRNKMGRIIASLQPLFEAGKYYIHRNHVEARDELLSVGVSRWDDLVDTLAYAEQILTPVFFDTKKEPVKVTPWTKRQDTSNYGYEI